MSNFPALSEYNGAVQTPRLAFGDPTLKCGTVETTGLGLPRALGGGFAITYTVTASGRKYAVRCFHRPVPKLEVTYSRISSALCADNSDFFVGFEYQPTGILVNGQKHPIVKMDWAEGKTLGEWLESNSTDRASLDQTRRHFSELEAHLRTKGYAHGDIQNGNVIINGRPRLVDYDGVYVPTLQRGQGSELGHKHFQHPRRSPVDFGPEMDRFSFILVDLSLQALIAQPSLFAKYSNGENIVFTASDFADPSKSAIFQELLSTSTLKSQAVNFAKICTAPIKGVPALSDFIAGRNIPTQPTIVISQPPAGRGPGPTPYIGAFEVIEGSDFSKLARRIGDRVELVGLIREVRVGTTRFGKPYIFLNFGDWRSNQIKINIWSEGLAKLSQPPIRSWRGRWVSVTGLVDPPYTNRRNGYTHLSVTITEPNQLRTIDEMEADRRLGRIKSTASAGINDTVRDTLGHVGIQNVPPRHTGLTGVGPPATPPISGVKAGTPNQQILTRLGSHAPKPISGSSVPPAAVTVKPPTPSLFSWKKIWWTVAAGAALLAVIQMSQNSRSGRTHPSEPKFNGPAAQVPDPKQSSNYPNTFPGNSGTATEPLSRTPTLPRDSSTNPAQAPSTGPWPKDNPNLPIPTWPKDSGMPKSRPSQDLIPPAVPPPSPLPIDIRPDWHPPDNQPSSDRGMGGPYVPLPSPSRSLTSRDDVYWIQKQLQQLGFLRARPNGIWDNASSEALKDFKVLNQLSHDDVWDLSVQQKIISGGPVRAESTFVGVWSETPGCIAKSRGDAPLYISTVVARANWGRCDFNSVAPEEGGWRIRANCQVGAKRWDANIRMIVKSGELLWSSEKGTTRYFRCP
jgi:hypothetical protein